MLFAVCRRLPLTRLSRYAAARVSELGVETDSASLQLSRSSHALEVEAQRGKSVMIMRTANNAG